MSYRACVFVDGENFRHVICDLFDDFDPREHLPKSADWAGFFDWLVDEAAGHDAERIRTYWYVVQNLDFFPYRLPKENEYPHCAGAESEEVERLSRLLCQVGLQDELKGLKDEELRRRLVSIVDRLKSKRRRMVNRFQGWQTLYSGIATKHNAVEFRPAGSIVYNLGTARFGTEKAVDVKLATDLLMLRDIYDCAVIVSGDQDYVPAVQVVKDSGKKVVNVAFLTRGGKLLPGGARRLNQITDAVMQ